LSPFECLNFFLLEIYDLVAKETNYYALLCLAPLWIIRLGQGIGSGKKLTAHDIRALVDVEMGM
jgi:hypothetical protein